MASGAGNRLLGGRGSSMQAALWCEGGRWEMSCNADRYVAERRDRNRSLPLNHISSGEEADNCRDTSTSNLRELLYRTPLHTIHWIAFYTRYFYSLQKSQSPMEPPLQTPHPHPHHPPPPHPYQPIPPLSTKCHIHPSPLHIPSPRPFPLQFLVQCPLQYLSD